ncbi:4-alpha-glucanotransferase [Wenjunlia vitaminophila]|uniref:4-alpha-glucanotransferase n=1 Tax=Wenjunlia vitaminophila TaxID=76728 RepID=A0A0T6LJZ1_WENVI|nr:4-alpha-glucanotransferase [Wenjunlia vitaminophila]KRV46357.1 4-alpha-glucanotransferase [Wenjunlia vitaminophila]
MSHAAAPTPAANPALAELAVRYGVDTTHRPAPGTTVRVPDSTLVAVLAALGVDAGSPGAVRRALAAHRRRQDERLLPDCAVVRAGRTPRLTVPDGTRLRVRTEGGEDRPLAPDLPLGQHTVHACRDGASATAPLLVVPDRAPAAPARCWGLLVQVYSVLSGRSWGMGDLGDLGELAEWAGRTLKAGFVQVNPLHTAVRGAVAAPGDAASDRAPVRGPSDPSPYRPSSRLFPDPIYLRVEEVPEYAHLDADDRAHADRLAARAAELRAATLRPDGLIDRDAVWALKRAALELVHRVPLTPARRSAFRDFVTARGRALDDHATWCALAERHGPNWRSWPSGLRHPRGPAVAAARADHGELVDFHRWLAWLTDTQLAAAQRAARDAGMPVGIVHDLAVGAHPEGSDAWVWQDVLASGISVGAPPDAFNARGQDWGLPPWRPDALAAAGYAPFRELLRGPLRHAGALRLDHVMGLFRLWWVPRGRPPQEGTYVRHDAEAMLGVLALEAHRAGAVVIGEDLGTVESGVRERLAERGVLGTSVLWFEHDPDGDGAPLPPGRWRTGCLATATTHDLPSTAAHLTGEHVDLRDRLGLLTRPAEQVRAEAEREVAGWLALLERQGLLPEGVRDEETVIAAVYRFLLRTPATLVGVWLPDAVGDRRPQNVPGTCAEYPNWRLPVADASGRPRTLEQLASASRLHALVNALTSDSSPD